MSLQIGDAPVGEHARRLGVLDPFGHRLDAEMARQIDERAHEKPVVRGARQILDESAVDFQMVDVQRPEIAERCVARAEIVHGDFQAEPFHRADQPARRLDVGYRQRLGDLDGQALRAAGPGGEGVGELRRPFHIIDAGGRYVDRQFRLRVLREAIERQFQHALVDEMGEPDFLRRRQDRARGGEAAVAGADAHQRLMEGGGAVAGPHDRLIGEDNAPLVQRRDDLVRQAESAQPRLLAHQARGIGDEAGACGLARLVQRLLGALQQRLRASRLTRRHRPAEPHRGRERPRRGRDRRDGDGLRHAPRRDDHLLTVTEIEDRDEAVARLARDKIRGAQIVLEKTRETRDQLVGDIIAVLAVDQPEIVDGGRHGGEDGLVALGALIHGFEVAHQLRAAGDTGEAVAAGVVDLRVSAGCRAGQHADDPVGAAGVPVRPREPAPAVVDGARHRLADMQPVDHAVGDAVAAVLGHGFEDGVVARRPALLCHPVVELLAGRNRLNVGQAENLAAVGAVAQPVGADVPVIHNAADRGQNGAWIGRRGRWRGPRHGCGTVLGAQRRQPVFAQKHASSDCGIAQIQRFRPNLIKYGPGMGKRPGDAQSVMGGTLRRGVAAPSGAVFTLP